MTRIRYLPQLFRGPFLRKVASNRHYGELAERLTETSLSHLLSLKLSDIFEAVYEVLLQHYRCEYVFKNALTAHCLSQVRKHGPLFLTDEFRVGRNRVDLAVFGETSIAYEIKTDFDSTARLPSQTLEYAKVFDLVYVVTTAALRRKVEQAVPKTIGLMELRPSGDFSILRESESHAHSTNLAVAFDCLRRAEMISIFEQVANSTIDLPKAEIYRECKRKFHTLLPFEAHSQMLWQISRRGFSAPSESLMFDAPRSLKHAALMLRASKREINNIRIELGKAPTPLTHNPRHEHVLPIPARQAERAVSPSRA